MAALSSPCARNNPWPTGTAPAPHPLPRADAQTTCRPGTCRRASAGCWRMKRSMARAQRAGVAARHHRVGAGEERGVCVAFVGEADQDAAIAERGDAVRRVAQFGARTNRRAGRSPRPDACRDSSARRHRSLIVEAEALGAPQPVQRDVPARRLVRLGMRLAPDPGFPGRGRASGRHCGRWRGGTP